MWELNLAGSIPSRVAQGRHLFVAKRGVVHRFSLAAPTRAGEGGDHGEEEGGMQLPEAGRCVLGPGRRVNQMRCGRLGGVDVVVVASDMLGDSGSLQVFAADAGFVTHSGDSGSGRDISRPLFSYVHHAPVWSIDMHEGTSRLACGTNGHDVLWWDIPGGFEGCLGDSVGEEVAEFWAESGKHVLKGHLHNVPCIRFSPCGRFLASASIDTSLRPGKATFVSLSFLWWDP